MPLPVTGTELVQLDRGTGMWIQLITFDLCGAGDDQQVLGELVATPGYAHDYASPATGEKTAEVEVHGRWHLAAITVDRFARCSPEQASRELLIWARGEEPGIIESEEALSRLARVTALFDRGNTYRLDTPGAEAEHDYGWVIGEAGFHEYVVIDRPALTLSLIVAADD